MIPRTVLIACRAFDGLSARRVCSAVGRGIAVGGLLVDLCPLPQDGPALDERELLAELDLDARIRPARAVIVGEHRLRARPAAQSVTLEIATRARQAGVPAYAVTAVNALDAFDARVFDLQLVLEASSSGRWNARGDSSPS